MEKRRRMTKSMVCRIALQITVDEYDRAGEESSLWKGIREILDARHNTVKDNHLSRSSLKEKIKRCRLRIRGRARRCFAAMMTDGGSNPYCRDKPDLPGSPTDEKIPVYYR